MSLFGTGKPAKKRWVVCEPLASRKETPCLFYEETGMRRGDPPRCIRHGALLFSDSTLDGLSREEAKKRIREDILVACYMQFIERQVGSNGQGPLVDIGQISGQPVGIDVGTEIEIDYHDYLVVGINRILDTKNRELTYQIHVEKQE